MHGRSPSQQVRRLGFLKQPKLRFLGLGDGLQAGFVQTDAAAVQLDGKQHAEVRFEANQSQTRTCLLTGLQWVLSRTRTRSGG